MSIKQKRTIGLKQLIIVGTILLTAGMLYMGIYKPNSIIMGFADISLVNTLLRASSLVVLIAILFSRPPRSLMFRIVLGAMSSLILIISFISMMNYHIGVLDAVIYLQVAIIFALESLEYETGKVSRRQVPYSAIET